MALKLTKDFDNGFQAEYFRIKSFSVNMDSPSVNVSLQLYKDEAARRSGKFFIEDITVVIKYPTIEALEAALSDVTGSLLKVLYTKVKELPEFSGAVDCQEDLTPPPPPPVEPEPEVPAEEVPPTEEPTTPPEEEVPPTEGEAEEEVPPPTTEGEV